MNISVPTARIVRVRRNRRRFPNVDKRVSLSDFLGYLHRAVFNMDVLGLTQGVVVNTTMLIALFRQPVSNDYFDRPARTNQPLKKTASLRQRVSRFVEDRSAYRDRPHFFPELILFAIIVIVAIWPMLSLPAAMERLH
jgi:hypothetical protein